MPKKIYADGSEQSYAYAGGRLSATKDARNRTTQFGYDNNGNLTLVNYPNDADVNLTYNALDKPLTMTDGLGTTQFGYDTAARLTSVDGPWQNDTVNYAYDAEGRRSALGVQKPDGTLDTTGYVYDALGRLDQITSSAGTFDYNYQDNTSRITQLLMPNGARTDYSYTALGELDVLQNLDANGANISRYDYNYDARGVRAALQEQIEADPVKTLLFSYDVTNQLAGEQVTGGAAGEAYTSTYDYDAAGNRSKYTKTSATENIVERTSNNSLNQTTAVKNTFNGTASTSGLSYDEAGNLAQVSSSSGASEYLFDDANRLKAVVSKNAAGVNQAKTELVYDGLSRLIVSKDFTWNNGAWQEQSQKRRVYDGMNAVQERDGDGALVALYVRGAEMGGGIGGLLARVFDVGTSFMHYDGRGNVVQLTDVSGAVSGKYTYDAFGRLLSITGGAAGLNPYRFSTKEHIGSLVYYGYRFYSPSLGKWINRDPMEEAGGLNVYGFVDGNPISHVDPNGLRILVNPDLIIREIEILQRTLDCLKAVLCGFAGIATNVVSSIAGAYSAIAKARQLHGLVKYLQGVEKFLAKSSTNEIVKRAAARATVAAIAALTTQIAAVLRAVATALAIVAASAAIVCGGVAEYQWWSGYFKGKEEWYNKGGTCPFGL